MNYYATCALIARVYLTKGEMTLAAQYAQEVIDAIDVAVNPFYYNDAFRLSGLSDIATSNDQRFFSSEMLFGLHASNLESAHEAYFTDNGYLKLPKNDHFDVVYEFIEGEASAGADDMRYTQMFEKDASTSDDEYTIKYKFLK